MSEKRHFSRFLDNGVNVVWGKNGTWTDAREVSASLSLPAGRYCLVPSPYQPAPARYLVRLYTETRWRCEAAGAETRADARDPWCRYRCWLCCCGSLPNCCSTTVTCCHSPDTQERQGSGDIELRGKIP